MNQVLMHNDKYYEIKINNKSRIPRILNLNDSMVGFQFA